jgi:cell division protein FtsL
MRRSTLPGGRPRSQVKLPWINHRLVLEPDRGRMRELLLAVSLSGVMLLPLLLYVRQSSEWLRAGYRMEELKNQRERLIETHRQLRLEKASLESLARVEQVAELQLGLAQPPAGTVVLVDTSRIARVPPAASDRIASGVAVAGAGQHRPDRESETDAHDHRSN